jgi:drug/metabolite transporter (DMT)-like permease
VLAVALAIVSAVLFGAMTVAVRAGLRAEADVAALATVVPALAIALAAVGVEAAVTGDADVSDAWPFALAGLLAPGGSQLLFTLAIRDAGPSRTSIAVGTAPLVSVVIALIALDEPVRAPLLAGAALVVVGGIALVSEPVRPDHVRSAGLVFAGGATLLFATRDNVIRWLSRGDAPRPTTAAAATLLVGTLVALAYARRRPSRGELRAFVPAGVAFGLSYVCLFEAYYRGRVTVVSPLVATESLFGVAFSAALYRAREAIGLRLALGAALIVAGGALIGIFR